MSAEVAMARDCFALELANAVMMYADLFIKPPETWRESQRDAAVAEYEGTCEGQCCFAYVYLLEDGARRYAHVEGI